MTFDEACRVENPHGISWKEKYDRYIRHIGRENIRKHLPAKPAELAQEWLADENFNGMPLRKWETAAGFEDYRDSQSTKPPTGKGPFIRMLRACGITEFSMSECISLLKRCAELEARDYLSEVLANRPGQERQDLEIWAVFEHCSARTDKANRYNIFDFDCTAAFRDEAAASRYESYDPGRRVKKLVRIRNVSVSDLLAPAGYRNDGKGGAPDA